MNIINRVISDSYLKEQIELHQRDSEYGSQSINHAPNVQKVMNDLKLSSLSDYGAGKKHLQTSLIKLGLTDFDYFPYDPAYPEYGKPTSADMVACIDVLEHIEEEYLDNVLEELKLITRKVIYLCIASGPARKVLKDGRNAHLIQKPPRWWLPKLCKLFNIEYLESQPKRGFVVICSRLKNL